MTSPINLIIVYKTVLVIQIYLASIVQWIYPATIYKFCVANFAQKLILLSLCSVQTILKHLVHYAIVVKLVVPLVGTNLLPLVIDFVVGSCA